MRWSGTLRGMGAPGFIAYWIGGAVFLLEYTFFVNLAKEYIVNINPLGVR